jgi:hypothetical protein
MVDPTGNFSMGSMMSAINVMGTLSTVATTTYDIGSMFLEEGDGSAAPSARDIGGALIAGLVGKKLFKPLYGLCKKNKKARRYCNYVVGYVGAELKIEALVQSKKSNWLNKKRKTTVVGAFDLATGKSAAAFNLGKQKPPMTHPSLKSALNKVGVHEGCSAPGVFGSTNIFGNCAEFQAANKLMSMGVKKKAIRWTLAYDVDKTGTFGGRGFIKPYCANCIGLFNLKN